MSDILNEQDSVMFRMNGNSMFPNLRDGDLGVIQKCSPGDLQIGDIVVFRTNKNFIAHRLTKILHKDGQIVFVAQGDKNLLTDPPFSTESFSGKMIGFKRKDKIKTIDRKGGKVFLLHFRCILIPCYNLVLRFNSYAKKLRDNLRLLSANLRVIGEKSGSTMLPNVLIALLQGVVPFLLILCIKLLVDALTGLEAGAVAGTLGLWTSVLPLILLTAAVFLLNALITVVRGYFFEKLSHSVTHHTYEMLHQKHAELDLEYYENPQLQDKIHRAVQEAGFRPVKIMNELLALIKSVVSLIVMLVIFLSIRWYLVALLVVAILPGFFIRLKYSGKRYRLRGFQSPAEREMSYFNRILTGFPFAKELRLFGFSEFFLHRFSKIEEDLHVEKIRLQRSEMWADIFANCFAIVLIFMSLAYVAYLKATGLISIGSVVLFFFVFQRGFSVLNEMLRSITLLLEDNTFLNDFTDFLNLPVKAKKDFSGSFSLNKGISVKNVSFRYPTSKRDSLSNVCLNIPAGKTVAFVGANGSGKTTMIKLLCGFYQPVNGEIRYDDQTISQIGEIELRKNISAVFQDFALYNVSALENVALGDIYKKISEKPVREAAQAAGIADLMERLPGGYYTMLGHLFKDGEELSIGQWQKIAIARAFYRDAPVLFMDEPSSALDVDSERQMLESMRHLAQNKTVVIISHRLSTVQWADQIVVFDRGQIVESGSHEDLLELKGKYFTMFQMNRDK